MSTTKKLHARSESKCELCTSLDDLSVYQIPPTSKGTVDDSILVCSTCMDQIENQDRVESRLIKKLPKKEHAKFLLELATARKASRVGQDHHFLIDRS